jgi:hypothetical protein
MSRQAHCRAFPHASSGDPGAARRRSEPVHGTSWATPRSDGQSAGARSAAVPPWENGRLRFVVSRPRAFCQLFQLSCCRAFLIRQLARIGSFLGGDQVKQGRHLGEFLVLGPALRTTREMPPDQGLFLPAQPAEDKRPEQDPDAPAGWAARHEAPHVPMRQRTRPAGPRCGRRQADRTRAGAQAADA